MTGGAHFTVHSSKRYTPSYVPPLSYISPKPLTNRFTAHAYVMSPTAAVAPRVVSNLNVDVKQETDPQQFHEKEGNSTL